MSGNSKNQNAQQPFQVVVVPVPFGGAQQQQACVQNSSAAFTNFFNQLHTGSPTEEDAKVWIATESMRELMIENGGYVPTLDEIMSSCEGITYEGAQRIHGILSTLKANKDHTRRKLGETLAQKYPEAVPDPSPETTSKVMSQNTGYELGFMEKARIRWESLGRNGQGIALIAGLFVLLSLIGALGIAAISFFNSPLSGNETAASFSTLPEEKEEVVPEPEPTATAIVPSAICPVTIEITKLSELQPKLDEIHPNATTSGDASTAYLEATIVEVILPADHPDTKKWGKPDVNSIEQAFSNYGESVLGVVVYLDAGTLLNIDPDFVCEAGWSD